MLLMCVFYWRAELMHYAQLKKEAVKKYQRMTSGRKKNLT